MENPLRPVHLQYHCCYSSTTAVSAALHLRPRPINPISAYDLKSFLVPIPLARPKPLARRHVSRAISTEDIREEPSAEELSHHARHHNARSAALLHHLSRPSDEAADEEELWNRRVAEEMALCTRRTACFPGSIDFPTSSSTERLGELARALGPGESRMLQRALQFCRGVAAEMLKEALRAGKLSITYSTNLVASMGGFVDRVVIEAAATKGDSNLSHLSFNARAKHYIQSSGLVPLVK